MCAQVFNHFNCRLKSTNTKCVLIISKLQRASRKSVPFFRENQNHGTEFLKD